MSDIQTVFGGSNPIQLSEYYQNAPTGYCSNVATIPNVNTQIPMSVFYGKSKPVISIMVAGNAAANISTTGMTVLSILSEVDDNSVALTPGFPFYFLGVEYGLAGTMYWTTNNFINFGAPNSVFTIAANAVKGIILGGADRRTNTFYVTSKLTSGSVSYINTVNFFQNLYSDGIPNAGKWQIRYARDLTYQYVELRASTAPSTGGTWNISDGASFLNTMGSFTNVTPGNSYVLRSDLNGNSWTWFPNYYLNI